MFASGKSLSQDSERKLFITYRWVSKQKTSFKENDQRRKFQFFLIWQIEEECRGCCQFEDSKSSENFLFIC